MAITSIKTGSSFTNLVKYNDFLAGNPAFIPSSYESIASATGTGSSGTITFSSIPSTYSHLQIRGLAFSNAAVNSSTITVRFNSDSGSNYAYHRLLGDGSAVYAVGSATQTNMFLGGAVAGTNVANVGGATIIDIHDYSSTTKNKTLRSFNGSDGNTGGGVYYLELNSGLWQSTSAINSITLICGADNFTTSTTFALYGIRG
jgi:hypothetical protein